MSAIIDAINSKFVKGLVYDFLTTLAATAIVQQIGAISSFDQLLALKAAIAFVIVKAAIVTLFRAALSWSSSALVVAGIRW